MADCPECGSRMNQSQNRCSCGWVAKKAPPIVIRNGNSKPSAVLHRAFGVKHEEVTNFVKQYQQEHKTNKRDACMAYLKREGIEGFLPVTLKNDKTFDEAMDEYRETIEA